MNDLTTLLRICQEVVQEVKENNSIKGERCYIMRELFEDLRLEVEKINDEAQKILRDKVVEEDQADRFLHNRNFPDGREPNNF